MKSSASISLPVSLPAGALYRAPQIEHVRAQDGFELAYRHWPAATGGAVVLYLHGIEGHSQWFENTASHLASVGTTVYAFDRRGSGLNMFDRGHMTSYKALLSDNDHLLTLIRERHGLAPIFLMANCWGAKAAVLLASRDYKSVDGRLPTPISGLILTNPAIKTKVDLDFKSKLKIAYYILRGPGHTSKRLPIPLTAEMLTDNPTYLSYIEKDPLRLKEATAQFYLETLKLTLMAQSKASLIEMPLLVLQSGKDQIVDLAALARWYSRCKSADKTWQFFPEATHSLDFDGNCWRQYVDVLGDWVESRTAVGAK